MVIFHSFLYVYQRVSTIFYPMTHDRSPGCPTSKQAVGNGLGQQRSGTPVPSEVDNHSYIYIYYRYVHVHTPENTYTYTHMRIYTYRRVCIYIYIYTLHIHIYMLLYNIHAHNAHIYIHRRGMTWPYVCKSIWYKKSCNQLHPTCQKMGTCQENRRLRETTGPVDHATPTRTSLAGTHHGSHKLHGEWTWDLFYHLVI